MRPIALLLPVGLLLAGCPGPRIQPPEWPAPTVIRVALPRNPALAIRMEAALAGVEGIVRVPPGGGEADVAVAWGILEEEGMAAEPLAAWDRTWFLEVDPLARWVNDPNFRRWLAARIDRTGMARVLFGEGAEPILSGVREAGPRPVSAGARPRLQIVRHAGDRTAERIVSRLRADLLPYRVLVEPVEATQDRAIALRLVDQDPVHCGTETDTVIPLFRERAFLLVRTGLTGITAGPDGTLSFEHARWAP